MLPGGTRCPASAAASGKLPVYPLETLHENDCPRQLEHQAGKHTGISAPFSAAS